MSKEQQKIALQIMAALKDVEIPFNTNIYIEISDRISIKVTEHIYGE